MKKTFLIAFTLIFIISMISFSFDGTILIDKNNENGVIIESYSADEIVLKASVNELIYRFHLYEENIYSEMFIQNESIYGDFGNPQFPVFYKLLQIPDSIDYKVTYTYGKTYDIDLLAETGTEYLYPAQPPISKTPQEIEFIKNIKAYQVNEYLPESLVIINDEIIARGRRLIPLTIFPVKYNPESQIIRVYSDIEIRIDIIDPNIAKTHQSLSRYESSFSRVYDYATIGSRELKDLSGIKGFSDEGILVIIADNLYSGITPFIEWKEKKGYRVTLTKQSDITNGNTNTGIKNYIQNAYDNWPVPPSSVILVGDTDTIPTFSGNESNSAADVYYVYLEGNDSMPDAGISRISVRTIHQLNTYLNKLLYYEQHQNPNIQWMTDAALISGEDFSYYDIGEGTLNWLINSFLNSFNWTYDELYRHTHNTTKAEVIASLNAGKVLANYTAHCHTNNWGFRSGGQYIYNSDVHALNNQNMYFFAIGNCCQSARFDVVNESIGEAFIRAENAAIAYWGASNNSYWGPDDILAKRSYTAFFSHNIHKLDQNVNYAKVQLWNYYSGNSTARYYMDMYNLLGDGTTFMPTLSPVNPAVNAPDSIAAGTASIEVSVFAEGNPVNNALVSAYNPDIGIRGASRTDSSGNAVILLDSPASIEGEFTLLVTHPNLINYEKSINIGESGLVAVYRFFNTVTGGHLYTISSIERDYIQENLHDWNYEGIAFYVYSNQIEGTLASYRFFNTNTGIHLYTISEVERDAVMDLPEWNYEGINFYVYPAEAPETIAVFRFFNHIRGGHLYTISEIERDSVMQLPDWSYEGISFYVKP